MKTPDENFTPKEGDVLIADSNLYVPFLTGGNEYIVFKNPLNKQLSISDDNGCLWIINSHRMKYFTLKPREWEPKKGEMILVNDDETDHIVDWPEREFYFKDEKGYWCKESSLTNRLFCWPFAQPMPEPEPVKTEEPESWEHVYRFVMFPTKENCEFHKVHQLWKSNKGNEEWRPITIE